MTTGTEAKYPCTKCKKDKPKDTFYEKADNPGRGYTSSWCRQCMLIAEQEAKKIRQKTRKPRKTVKTVRKKSQEEIAEMNCCPECEMELVPLFGKPTDKIPLPPKIGLICTWCAIEFLIEGK